jgi:6-phosphogluconolactonase
MPAEIHVFEHVPDLIEACAQALAERAAQAIAERGAFHVALSGGSTPRPIYERWAGLMTDWEHVHIWFGDERCVSPEQPESNYRMARESLLDLTGIPAANIQRIEGELEQASEAAARADDAYQALIKAGGTLDLVLLGLGDDAHTASLFPTTAALTVDSARFVENHVPKLGVWRVTLTYAAINAARAVMFIVTGASKAEAVRKVLRGKPDVTFVPAQGIQPTSGDLHWYLDTAAAAKLKADPPS